MLAKGRNSAHNAVLHTKVFLKQRLGGLFVTLSLNFLAFLAGGVYFSSGDPLKPLGEGVTQIAIGSAVLVALSMIMSPTLFRFSRYYRHTGERPLFGTGGMALAVILPVGLIALTIRNDESRHLGSLAILLAVVIVMLVRVWRLQQPDYELAAGPFFSFKRKSRSKENVYDPEHAESYAGYEEYSQPPQETVVQQEQETAMFPPLPPAKEGGVADLQRRFGGRESDHEYVM